MPQPGLKVFGLEPMRQLRAYITGIVFYPCRKNLHQYMYTLGINAAFHDSAACIVRNGRVLAAAEEERFTHIKHGKRPVPFSTYELPFHAIDYCLNAAGIHINEVDHFAYSFDPYILLGDEYRKTSHIDLPLKPGEADSAGWLNPWDPL